MGWACTITSISKEIATTERMNLDQRLHLWLPSLIHLNHLLRRRISDIGIGVRGVDTGLVGVEQGHVDELAFHDWVGDDVLNEEAEYPKA